MASWKKNKGRQLKKEEENNRLAYIFIFRAPKKIIKWQRIIGPKIKIAATNQRLN